MADLPGHGGALSGGLDYAAVFLLGVGPDDASLIMKQLNPREIQRLAASMSRPRKVVRETMEVVMQDFVDRLKHQTSIGGRPDSYLREVLAKAMGKDKASEILDRIVTGGEYAGLEIIKWADPKTIAEMILAGPPRL